MPGVRVGGLAPALMSAFTTPTPKAVFGVSGTASEGGAHAAAGAYEGVGDAGAGEFCDIGRRS